MVPVALTSTSYESRTSNLACTVRAVVGASNRIESVDYEGNNGACMTYAGRLKAAGPVPGRPAASATPYVESNAPDEVVNCRRDKDGGPNPPMERIARQQCRGIGGTVVYLP